MPVLLESQETSNFPLMLVKEKQLPSVGTTTDSFVSQWFDYKNQIEVKAVFKPLIKCGMPAVSLAGNESTLNKNRKSGNASTTKVKSSFLANEAFANLTSDESAFAPAQKNHRSKSTK